jgi:MoaA/NifB/PqqE/SkfB family radical SAM enzyme
LEKQLNEKMVDEVKANGGGITQYIRYSGNGEPLLNRSIFDMLTYAVENSGTTVTLTTNGTLLDERRIERLLATKLNLVDVSLDAFSTQTYSRIRVNGDLTVVRENVRQLIKKAQQGDSGTKVVVSFIEQPENSSEIPAFEQFWREEGASQVVVRRLHTNANSTTRLANLLARSELPTRRPCLYPWERILLTPAGQLAFCPQDWKHASVLGDFRQTTIKDVWQSDFYRRLRDAHLTGNFCDHKFCGQCADWAITRWPGTGLSYADLVQGIKPQAT